MNLNHMAWVEVLFVQFAEFISIDCGLAKNSSYKNWRTGIDYISDLAFIDSGKTKEILNKFKITINRKHGVSEAFLMEFGTVTA